MCFEEEGRNSANHDQNGREKNQNATFVVFSDLCGLELLGQSSNAAALLLSKASAKLSHQGRQLDLHTLLLGVVGGQTHLLDADLASSQLFFTENDGIGDGTLLGSLELLGQLGLQLVGELGLVKY